MPIPIEELTALLLIQIDAYRAGIHSILGKIGPPYIGPLPRNGQIRTLPYLMFPAITHQRPKI